MKNLFIVLMNVLFLAVVAADVVAVKYECNTAPVVQNLATKKDKHISKRLLI